MTVPRDFPFPLAQDAYRYTLNLQPGGRREVTATGAWGDAITRVGPDYATLIAERARILGADPGRLVRDSRLLAAEWDALGYLMRHLAAEHPADFSLTEPGHGAVPGKQVHDDGEPDNGAHNHGVPDNGAHKHGAHDNGVRDNGVRDGRVHWDNRLLGTTADFVPGDESTLPTGPLEFIGRQVVEDLVLLTEREGHLWVDAGLVTFASGWSFPFAAGMTFQEIHGPVPRANADGVFTRAEAFLTALPPGAVYRRVNWTFQAGRLLDHSLDDYDTWAAESERILSTTPDDRDLADQVHLRVELQHLIRLETSAAVLFLIDTRFLSLAELAAVPEWAARCTAVLTELPADMAGYKGLTDLGPRILNCLHALSAGRQAAPGPAPLP